MKKAAKSSAMDRALQAEHKKHFLGGHRKLHKPTPNELYDGASMSVKTATPAKSQQMKFKTKRG